MVGRAMKEKDLRIVSLGWKAEEFIPGMDK